MTYMCGTGAFEGTFVCECICQYVALNACVCSDFVYVDFVLEPHDEVYNQSITQNLSIFIFLAQCRQLVLETIAMHRNYYSP